MKYCRARSILQVPDTLFSQPVLEVRVDPAVGELLVLDLCLQHKIIIHKAAIVIMVMADANAMREAEMLECLLGFHCLC